MTGVTPDREQGFTLIELLIVIMISGLILSALSTAFITTMRGSQNVHEMFIQSHDAQLLATSFVSDVQSANPLTVDTAATSRAPGRIPGRFSCGFSGRSDQVLKAFSASYRLVPPTPPPTPPATAPSRSSSARRRFLLRFGERRQPCLR